MSSNQPGTHAQMDRKWLVWYLQWRFHSSRVETWEENTREAAFISANYLEHEAEDCVNEVVGIEGPDGNFIDMQEYRAVEKEVTRKREELWKASLHKDDDQPRFRITVTGPPRPEGVQDGQKGTHYVVADVSYGKYLKEDIKNALERFGPDRVKIEPYKRRGE